MQYWEHKTEQQNILAIEIQDFQDTMPKPSNKEKVLVLANNAQDTSQDYDTSNTIPVSPNHTRD